MAKSRMTKKKDSFKDMWFILVYLAILAVVFTWIDYRLIGAPFCLLIIFISGLFFIQYS